MTNADALLSLVGEGTENRAVLFGSATAGWTGYRFSAFRQHTTARLLGRIVRKHIWHIVPVSHVVISPSLRRHDAASVEPIVAS